MLLTADDVARWKRGRRGQAMVHTVFESQCIALPLLLLVAVRVGEGTRGLSPSAYLPKYRGTYVNSQKPVNVYSRVGATEAALNRGCRCFEIEAEHRASTGNCRQRIPRCIHDGGLYV